LIIFWIDQIAVNLKRKMGLFSQSRN